MAEENKAIEWPGGANVADDFDFLMVGKDGQPIMKIPKEKLNEVIVINGEGIKAVAGGTSSATPTILAPGPAGQNRKMEDVTGWFVNGTGNPLVATGTPWEAPAGFKNTNWWDGTTWSLGSSVALPATPVADEIVEGGEMSTSQDAVWKGTIKPVDLQYGPSSNGQLYNRATNTLGVVLASAVPSTVLEDYIVDGVGGQNSKPIPVIGSTNYTFSWDGSRPNRRTIWLNANMEVISFIGDWGNNQTRQSPPDAAFFIFCAKRNDATEPTEDLTIKFEQGDTKTPGVTYDGGIEAIKGAKLITAYSERAGQSEYAERAGNVDEADTAKNLKNEAKISEIGNSPFSVLNKAWWMSSLDMDFPNGQLYDRNTAITDVSMALPAGGSTVIDDYILKNINGGKVSQPMPVEEGKSYTMSWDGAFANRRGIWIDKDFNVIEFVGQWAKNQTRIAPVGAKWYMLNARRSANLEPTEDLTIKFEQSISKTDGIDFQGVIKKIGSYNISGASNAVTQGKIFVAPKLFLAKGITLPIYKTSLQWDANELDRDYTFASLAQNHTDFGLPMYRDITYAGARIKHDEVGDNFVIFSKNFKDKTDYDIGVSGDIVKVDPAAINTTVNFLGIGDSNTFNMFLPAVRPRLLHYAPGLIFNQFGGRGSSPASRHDFRSGWSYSSFTGRRTRMSASTVITPYEAPADLSNTSKNSFIRLATQSDKDNTPEWCFRNSGQYQELSYLEDPDKSGDFWIFDFSLYLSRIGNPSLDLIYIHLGSNDITNYGDIENAELCCKLMLTKIREVLPNVKIGVVGSIGRGEYSDDFPIHCEWIDRLNIIAQDFPGVDIVPLWMHINRNFSYPYDNEELVDENGNLTSILTKGDQVHIGVTGSGEFGDALASWILTQC